MSNSHAGVETIREIVQNDPSWTVNRLAGLCAAINLSVLSSRGQGEDSGVRQEQWNQLYEGERNWLTSLPKEALADLLFRHAEIGKAAGHQVTAPIAQEAYAEGIEEIVWWQDMKSPADQPVTQVTLDPRVFRLGQQFGAALKAFEDAVEVAGMGGRRTGLGQGNSAGLDAATSVAARTPRILSALMDRDTDSPIHLQIHNDRRFHLQVDDRASLSLVPNDRVGVEAIMAVSSDPAVQSAMERMEAAMQRLQAYRFELDNQAPSYQRQRTRRSDPTLG